jgi:hypothetical protein
MVVTWSNHWGYSADNMGNLVVRRSLDVGTLLPAADGAELLLLPWWLP